ncbi:MAG: acyl-ACP--UDP-N-acetylglucosamine O-acyltransferase [Proteobacteria bacterium]|nr:acyl-ACP--UDP-N-acetylglucosamine O-acyltransferase [Pseudomonadota bacterium]MCP4920273.1 acyl-ACP--UDP-N-acetylglucosamine O-acyltransferase [Pseudomonadota bacterium]
MPIHSTAIVDPSAELGDVEIGPYAIVGAEVKLADGVVIGPHVVLTGPMSIGARTVVHPFATLGGDAQDLKFAGERSELIIGQDNIIRENVTMNRGTAHGGGVTRVGSHNLFMASSHVAHDCTVGDHCVFANSVALAGHVTVHDRAVLGGLAGVHQHARIGRCAMVGAGAMVALDVPPFTIAQGDRARLFGLNIIGLRRAGFDADGVKRLRLAYRALFGGSAPLRMSAERLREAAEHEDIVELAAFIEASVRGVCRAAGNEGVD